MTNSSNFILPTKNDLIVAYNRIAPFIHRTPVLQSSLLNNLAGCELFFKCENFQRMGAFKMRGALNAIFNLTEEQKSRGVATHSSGNFAQALSLSAKSLNIPAYIVMPENAPKVKKAAVLDYGAEVISCESTIQAREAMVEKVIQRTGATFVHPSNDTQVIIGNSTACKELIEEVERLDAIFSPVGGGGLLAGTALASKYWSPGTNVYAAEPEGADDAFRSFTSGEIKTNTSPITVADGLRTHLGHLNFPIIQQLVNEIILVTDKEIVEAMKLIWERMKIIVEPSSATVFGAVLKNKTRFANQRIGLIISGGNVDLKNLPF